MREETAALWKECEHHTFAHNVVQHFFTYTVAVFFSVVFACWLLNTLLHYRFCPSQVLHSQAEVVHALRELSPRLAATYGDAFALEHVTAAQLLQGAIGYEQLRDVGLKVGDATELIQLLEERRASRARGTAAAPAAGGPPTDVGSEQRDAVQVLTKAA